MAIQDEMYKKIVQEIDKQIEEERFNLRVKPQKAKEVAKMLTELSVDSRDAENLVNQYMAQIKNICKN